MKMIFNQIQMKWIQKMIFVLINYNKINNNNQKIKIKKVKKILNKKMNEVQKFKNIINLLN